MSAPNTVLSTIIYSGTLPQVATSSAATFLSNSSGSNRVYKVNSMFATNTSTASSDVTIYLVRANNSATPPLSTAGTYTMFNTVTIPYGSIANLIARDIQIWLQEGDSFQIQSSVNNAITVTCTYDIIG